MGAGTDFAVEGELENLLESFQDRSYWQQEELVITQNQFQVVSTATFLFIEVNNSV
ncbi:MAG: hypothetical protein WBD58_18025 [Geitlerinemataceae cyanobacterium]